MNDMINSQEQFADHVHEALRLQRDGDVLALSAHPLAMTSLVEDCFLQGEPITADVRGRVLQSVLRWAVDKLKPAGEPDWFSVEWRWYHILYHFYLQGMRVAEMAEQMAIAEQTLYQWRVGAVHSVAALLWQEWQAPQATVLRHRAALADRVQRYDVVAQRVMRATAVFPSAVPLNQLMPLLDDLTIVEVQQLLEKVAYSHLVMQDSKTQYVMAHPSAQTYLQTRLTPQEREKWHPLVADYALTKQDYLEAAQQYRYGGMYETAVQLLINHYQQIVDNFQTEQLMHLLLAFAPYELESESWVRLQIVVGQVAEILKDLDTALEAYQHALGAENRAIKATAYYRRAKAFQQRNIHESLAHYSYCVQLLAGTDEPLLAQVYIDRAWVYFQELHDLVKAEADLHEAERILPIGNRRGWADLHSALGELHYYKGETALAIHHQLQGWLAANETQDRQRMAKIAHNLGLAYVEGQQFDEALLYLQKGHDLAGQLGHSRLLATCLMSLGVCQFWLKDYPQAIHYYSQAHDLFVETGNDTGRTHALLNLAEAHMECGTVQEAQIAFWQAQQLAEEMGNKGLVKTAVALSQQYPALQSQWNERQSQALAVIREKGFITNRQYRELTNISQKQAVRDLNELVEANIIMRQGQGRGTKYLLR